MVKQEGNDIPTPVNMIWEGILMLPIFGIIDSKRAQDIMETMLAKISDTGSKFIILDILGVANVDSAVANHLIKISKATQLMGCESIISGVSPEIAQTLIGLGVELGDITTTGTLADALGLSFKSLGLEVRKGK